MPSFLSRFFGDKKTPLYCLIEPKSSDALGPWASEFAAYPEVVGYLSLGHIFLRDPERNDYAVLHPFKAAAKSYCEHSSLAEFESAVLRGPGFEDYVLRREHVEAIASRLGTLKAEEVYIPQPYPNLGGSELPETYGKGNV